MLDKLKIINKNQIIVLVIALVLVTVGYLNFSSINTTAEEASANEIEYAGIGDAKLVNASNVVEIGEAISTSEDDVVENVGENTITTETENTKNAEKENIKENIITNEVVETTNTNASKNTNTEVDEYFSQSKLNRQTMYSQMLETYQKILENDQISADQKGVAQTEIKNINDTKNKIMICENLIKVKGIEDVIIFVNEPSVSVVVKAKELKKEQIAQIQNIIEREMEIDISNIHISNKY
ncbi:MAG: SpoIIIAH-like family protein [Clostridia bacterium]|nr:SpoIIIAH-like family protein [Clostridia bacterium]